MLFALPVKEGVQFGIIMQLFTALREGHIRRSLIRLRIIFLVFFFWFRFLLVHVFSDAARMLTRSQSAYQ